MIIKPKFKGILGTRNAIKPFEYPFLYKAYETQNAQHWLAKEIALADDVYDWGHKLTEDQRNFLMSIFRFFVQTDVDICGAYMQEYSQVFKLPECNMAFATFAAMEATHIDAYMLLLETLGIDETEYTEFMQYKAMADKHKYLDKCKLDSIEDIAMSVSVYSAFTEGLQLFSTFAMLLAFPRNNLMKGMGQIVTFSIRDESLHVDTLIKVNRTILRENPQVVTPKFKEALRSICREVVELEFAFVDLAYDMGGCDFLDKQDVKDYIKYIGDRRCIELGVKPVFDQRVNPLPWVFSEVGSTEHTNFFEARPTTYTKGGVTDDWDQVFKPSPIKDQV